MLSGGRVDMFNVSQEHTISGIFIKHVLDDSPAKANASLKTGDRILEVSTILSILKLFNREGAHTYICTCKKDHIHALKILQSMSKGSGF